jgi:hypothetical protein
VQRVGSEKHLETFIELKRAVSLVVDVAVASEAEAVRTKSGYRPGRTYVEAVEPLLVAAYLVRSGQMGSDAMKGRKVLGRWNVLAYRRVGILRLHKPKGEKSMLFPSRCCQREPHVAWHAPPLLVTGWVFTWAPGGGVHGPQGWWGRSVSEFAKRFHFVEAVPFRAGP